MRLPAVFLLFLPLAEIAGFVLVGQWLGLLPTLALVIGSTVLGFSVLKHHGVSLAQKLKRNRAQSPEDTARAALDGTAQVFGGLLLIFPGFITDLIGLMLLIPFVRSWLWDRLKPRIVTMRSGSGFRYGGEAGPQGRDHPSRSPDGPGPVIDLDSSDYTRKEGNSSSPWIRRPPEP
ncbi:FxsA family protein [Rhizobium paknamense]|uniref:UPF0716 protein FxsA n=1 Tax=Rhizobium paknamense TaxID=1206817 RepID=A0ABU0II63_9HYPH|nr:FxsA family protein [Rhizobium paknamense]MDQ0457952.1 UPF0716 protein FxsA [Rhizobium paknamense]